MSILDTLRSGNGTGYQAFRDRIAARATRPTPTPAPNAFDKFYQTPLYQVPLQEGLDAINAGYAARGTLQSGAAMKAISDYGAGHASGALRDYFSLLGNQQAIGFNAAQGQAGAAGNYANSITGSNTNYANALSGLNSQYAAGVGGALGNLGNAYGQGAINTGNILANQQIQNANNTNSMIGGIGSALGNAAGYLAFKPYGGSPTNLLAGTPYA